MLGVLGGASKAPSEAGSGPSGDPSDVSTETWGGDKVGIFFTIGDASAATRIYYKDDAGGCPSSLPDDATLVVTLSPGVNSYESSYTDFCNWWAVHYKDGQYGAFVQATLGDSGECIACM